MARMEDLSNLCVFKGCPNGGRGWGTAWFPFPSTTDPSYDIWLENCGNKSILVRSSPGKRKFGLCSDHFTPDSFYDEERQKLRRDAVPEPYSPTFKRLFPLSKENTRIYDHNYAIVPNETIKILTSYKRNLFPLRRYNAESRMTPSIDKTNINQGNNGSKMNLASPKLKRENRSVRTYVKKNSTLCKNEDSTSKASSSIDSTELEKASRLAAPSTTSSLIVSNSSPGLTAKITANKRGRRCGIGSKTQGSNPQVGGSGLRDREVRILQETNNELRSQNKLLRKLNGQLKLKMKKCEDRNKTLKIMLETVSSIDGFLDLHRCKKLVVRNMIKEEIHKCKMLSFKNEG